MQPKPELYSSQYAEWFKDSDVIAAYLSRPPYARTAIEFLSELPTRSPYRGSASYMPHCGPLTGHCPYAPFRSDLLRPPYPTPLPTGKILPIQSVTPAAGRTMQHLWRPLYGVGGMREELWMTQ